MPNEQDDLTQVAEQPIAETPANEVFQEPVIEPAVEQPTAPEPVVEQPPAQEPEPIPEPSPIVKLDPVIIDTLVPTPEAPIVQEPEPITIPEQPVSEALPPEPQSTPPLAPKPVTEEVKKNNQEKSIDSDSSTENVPPPGSQTIPDQKNSSIPQKVIDLTPEELDAARRLWAMQNIKEAQTKSAKVRHQKREELLAQMVTYIKSHAPVTLHMIAYNLNISPRKASDCVRDLVPSGRVHATGNTTSRRYS